MTNVIAEMNKAGLTILGLSEVRWKDAGDFMSEGVSVIYTGGEESKNGISILLDEKVARCVNGVGPREMWRQTHHGDNKSPPSKYRDHAGL